MPCRPFQGHSYLRPCAVQPYISGQVVTTAPSSPVIFLLAFSSFPPKTPQSNTFMLGLSVPPPLTGFPDVSLPSLPAHLPQTIPVPCHPWTQKLSMFCCHPSVTLQGIRKWKVTFAHSCITLKQHRNVCVQSPCCTPAHTHLCSPPAGRQPLLATSAVSTQPFSFVYAHSRLVTKKWFP